MAVELRARAEQELAAHQEMKRSLEASFKKEETLLCEQLALSEKRQADLKQTADELAAARAAREAEANAAKAKAGELEVRTARLETELAERTEECHDLRAMGALRPRRGAEVAGDAKAQLDKSLAQPSWDKDAPGGAQAQQKLKFAEEREKEHQRNAELWKNLVATHEADLKASKEMAVELQKTLDARNMAEMGVQEEMGKIRSRENELQAKISELSLQASKPEGQDQDPEQLKVSSLNSCTVLCLSDRVWAPRPCLLSRGQRAEVGRLQEGRRGGRRAPRGRAEGPQPTRERGRWFQEDSGASDSLGGRVFQAFALALWRLP